MGREEEGRGGLCFQTKALPSGRMPSVPVQRPAAQGAPWGPRSPSALQSPPLSQPWGQPRLLPGRGWEKMAQTFEEGNKSPHSSLWKEMPSSGEGGRGFSVEGGQSPVPRRQPTHPRAAQHPRPRPQPPRLQPRDLRSGEGHLWWFAWRGGRGERGEAQSGPGGGPDRELHHSCLRVFQP